MTATAGPIRAAVKAVSDGYGREHHVLLESPSYGGISPHGALHDTRERLEADIREHERTHGWGWVEVSDVLGWLDRQAAITRAECALPDEPSELHERWAEQSVEALRHDLVQAHREIIELRRELGRE